MWSQGSHRKGGVLFLLCQHWNKLSPSHVCVGSMAGKGLMEALVVCCSSASWPADQVRQNRKNLCLQLRQRVKDGIRAETCDCLQVTGDSARPYLDQQANETHGAGESMFSRPHGTQLSKINEFFVLICGVLLWKWQGVCGSFRMLQTRILYLEGKINLGTWVGGM